MEHEPLHAQIFDAIHDPLVVIDEDGTVYAANPAALRFFDLALAGAAPRVRRAGFDLDVDALAVLVRRHERMCGVALTDRAGRDTGVLVDIDPSVGPPRHALLHFRARTESIARELWTDEAVAAVAHEFRSPLSAMRSALGVLASGDAGALSDVQRRFIDAVARGVGRLARIVDAYLDLGRVRAGVLAVDRAACDVRELIDGITGDLALCQPALASRIDVEVDPDVHEAYLDRDRVTQVILNLVYNAARFTPDARRLVLRARPAGREALDDPLRVLPFECLGEPRFVCLEVEDEGIGMSADVLAHVFDRYRAEAPDAPVTGAGAHLGLHISRALVEAQDGWMRMESRLGQGTTASVYLPADAMTARLLSRLRGADDAVQRLRAARRPAAVALIGDDEIRPDGDAPAWWPREWATNPARAVEARAHTCAWALRDGLALLVLSRGEVPDVDAAFAIGACRVEEGMTFPGALRAAAASLLESKQRRIPRAGSGAVVARD